MMGIKMKRELRQEDLAITLTEPTEDGMVILRRHDRLIYCPFNNPNRFCSSQCPHFGLDIGTHYYKVTLTCSGVERKIAIQKGARR